MSINASLTTSANGLEFIKRWEGCILKSYVCPAGKLTIGIGHVILPNEKFPDTITEQFALDLLSKDVKRFESSIYKQITVSLNQNQFDALVSFTFNVGTGGLINTGVQRSVNSCKFSEVPARLQEWCKFKVNGVTKINQGLLNRRKAESDLFIRADASVSLDKAALTQLQTSLRKLSLYIGTVDGLYGPRTEKAILDFIKLNTLSSNFTRSSMDTDLYVKITNS